MQKTAMLRSSRRAASITVVASKSSSTGICSMTFPIARASFKVGITKATPSTRCPPLRSDAKMVYQPSSSAR
jgi:hypothetical protein